MMNVPLAKLVEIGVVSIPAHTMTHVVLTLSAQY